MLDFLQVVDFLTNRVRCRGYRTYVPPAFYDRDGKYRQPPPFNMELPKTDVGLVKWGMP